MRNTLYTTTGALPLEHECYTRAILVNRHLVSGGVPLQFNTDFARSPRVAAAIS
jgi:hypothetical protein